MGPSQTPPPRGNAQHKAEAELAKCPATEMTTANEILRRSDEIRKTLDSSAIVVDMDQALFAKAAQVVWKEHDRYASIILRLGTFHAICNLLSIIGKRFQDAGIRDLCAEPVLWLRDLFQVH